MAETIQQLLRERIDDPTPAVKYADRVWTWREHLAEASTMAAALIGIADPQRPLHVGALLGNTPEMLTAMAAAALGGYVLCGINDTRRGPRWQTTFCGPTASSCSSIPSTVICSTGWSCPVCRYSTRRAVTGRLCWRRPVRFSPTGKSRRPTPS
ncbi:putative acyl-CoA synthase [Mycobacterium xenopi 3993]|nr:putative acyl-CoA synthase [Mycobacterium xenopi 3993]